MAYFIMDEIEFSIMLNKIELYSSVLREVLIKYDKTLEYIQIYGIRDKVIRIKLQTLQDKVRQLSFNILFATSCLLEISRSYVKEIACIECWDSLFLGGG